ncbi:MAG TPA: hypothetical protein VMI06_19130 [Terriglobia bacterium]|nr:hypothetical protein [Terriglobia bacterium]
MVKLEAEFTPARFRGRIRVKFPPSFLPLKPQKPFQAILLALEAERQNRGWHRTSPSRVAAQDETVETNKPPPWLICGETKLMSLQIPDDHHQAPGD